MQFSRSLAMNHFYQLDKIAHRTKIPQYIIIWCTLLVILWTIFDGFFTLYHFCKNKNASKNQKRCSSFSSQWNTKVGNTLLPLMSPCFIWALITRWSSSRRINNLQQERKKWLIQKSSCLPLSGVIWLPPCWHHTKRHQVHQRLLHSTYTHFIKRNLHIRMYDALPIICHSCQ
jgi:hypothetical protein